MEEFILFFHQVCYPQSQQQERSLTNIVCFQESGLTFPELLLLMVKMLD